MTSGAPWSVKGIDPKAREIAKDLARRSGMTLGEYLNQMLMDENAEASVETAPRRAAPVVAPRPLAGPLSARPVADSRPPKRNGDDLERVLAALNDMSARLESSERSQAAASARFEAAITDLKTDQARVAQRLQAVQLGGGGAGPDRTDTLRALEGALNKVAGHLQDGEARSRDALVILRREMGQEVQRVTDQLGLRVQEVENRSADAIAQVGAEVSRVASVVEQRLRRADDAQAESLEKLGAEIARITERLSERIAAAERRSAQAIDDVGEQMARVTDRIHQRQERSSSELADRMRQSEERTAKLLEEAREKIERRLAKRDGADVAVEETHAFAARWSPEALAAPPAIEPPQPPQPQSEPELAYPAFLEPPALAPTPQAVSAPQPSPVEIEPPSPPTLAAAVQPPEVVFAPRVDPMEALALELEADPADALAAAPAAAPAMAFDPLDDIDAPDPAESLRPSTRELIAAARAAARVSALEQVYRAPEPVADNDGDGIFAGASYRRARVSGSMRGMMLTGGAVASIGLAATGYVVLHPEIMGALNGTAPIAAEKIPVGPPSNAAPPPAAQAALTLTTPARTPAPASDAETLFLDAQTKVDGGDPSGVAPLQTAANLGYAPAQRRLGKLYEDGGAGVEKDAAEGRRWTQRAAANGDARGMHNLGLDYYEGSGGVKNLAVAAQWFNRAAELGLRDSQYNLARFYEAGMGVKQDLPTAYKWYLIAGRAGDTEAAARGEALKTQLKPALRASIEKEALAFRPDAAAPPASMTAALKTATPKQLALAQRALSKLGYYQGPDTGIPSQSLGVAIQQYQRDRGLAANGTLSPELVQTFANITQ